jgi:hypothetical protein
MLTLCSLFGKETRMGFLRSGKPLESVIQERKRNARVGVVLKAMHDAKPPEEGVTILRPLTQKLWNKKAGRYRYEKGISIAGKKVGGRFTTAPADAPLERKRKKPRR